MKLASASDSLNGLTLITFHWNRKISGVVDKSNGVHIFCSCLYFADLYDKAKKKILKQDSTITTSNHVRRTSAVSIDYSYEPQEIGNILLVTVVLR